MPLTVTNRSLDFTPADAERITGVPVAQQRDWRRRGILAEREATGWTRFKAEALIDLAVLGFFTRMGFSPSVLSTVRAMAVLPTLAGIYGNPNGYAFAGDPLTDRQRQGVVANSAVGASNHLLVITGDDMGNPAPRRVASYQAIGDVLASSGSPSCVVLDCHRLADDMIEKAGGPLFRFEVSVA